MRIIGKEQAIKAGAEIIYDNAILRTGSVTEARQEADEFVQVRKAQEDKSKAQ